jgi:hypothetical protein
MDLYSLIASEFHCIPDENLPVKTLMHLAAVAEKRRSDRFKAASDGKTYIG